jgi:DNA ligase-1
MEQKNLINLYSFAKNGKVKHYQAWYVEAAGMNIITTAAGYLGGKMTEKQTLCKRGLQGRSLNEQTVLMLDAKVSKKKDEGYKTAKEYDDRFFDGNGIGLTGNDILFMQMVQADDSVPKYETNRDWLPLPMLAQPFKEKKHKPPYFIQPKLDGVRCIASLVDGKVVLMSRGGQYYVMPHIERELTKIFDKYPDLVLDGELYTHGMPLERISGIARTALNKSGTQKDMFDSEKSLVDYHVYDIVSSDPQKIRLQNMLEVFQTFTGMRYIHMVETDIANDMVEAMEYHDRYVDAGYEGLIMREIETPYLVGARGDEMVKVKRFFEDDYTIVGCKVDEKRTVEDSFVFQLQDNDGNRFYSRPKGTAAQKNKFFAEIDLLIGKKATLRYLDKTVNGLPGKAHVKLIRNYE